MERETRIPWGGDNHDNLVKFRQSAMNDPAWTAFAPGDQDPTAEFEVIVRWDVTDERASVSEVALRPVADAPITGEVWRSVRIKEVVGWSRHELEWTRDHAAKVLRGRGDDDKAEQVERVDVPGERRRPGRTPTFGPEHWHEVAALYVAARAAGSATPKKDVAVELERRHPDDGNYRGITDRGDSRVKGWINRAKTLGYLDDEREND